MIAFGKKHKHANEKGRSRCGLRYIFDVMLQKKTGAIPQQNLRTLPSDSLQIRPALIDERAIQPSRNAQRSSKAMSSSSISASRVDKRRASSGCA